MGVRPDVLRRLLDPRAVAVVGATERPGYGARLLRNLLAGPYTGRVLPVSATRATVMDLPAVASLRDLPEAPDVAMVVVPPDAVAGVLADAAATGVGTAVVITTGFSETGTPDGRRRAAEVQAAVADHDLLVIGPNGSGYASADAGVWASTFSGLRPADAHPSLPAVLLSQSGGTGFGAAHERAQDLGFSFQAVLSLGNQELVCAEELAEGFLAGDTEVVALVCEGMRDVPALLRAARLARERGRSVVVLKVGRSEAGRAAAATHTASLASDDAVLDGVLRQHGIVRVDDVDELVQAVRYLALARRPQGRRAAVLSHSGGLGALAADALGAAGFELPDLSDSARARLDELLGDVGGRTNPVDITMALRDPVVTDVVATLGADDVDLVQVVTAGDPGLAERVAAADVPVPVHLVWTSGVRTGPDLAPVVGAELPCFTGVKVAAEVLARCRDAATDVVPVPPPPRPTGPDEATSLDEVDAKTRVAEAGVAVPDAVVAATIDELLDAAAGLPAPWALKITAPDVLHKAAAGLLALGLTDRDELARTARTLAVRAADLHGWRFLLEHQHDVGRELFVAATVDRDVGAVIGVGRGGGEVELDPLVAWATCPLDVDGADRLLHDVALGGWFGRALDAEVREVLATQVAALSTWFVTHPERPRELEINPLAVDRATGGLIALDAVLRVDAPTTRRQPVTAAATPDPDGAQP